MIDDLDRTLETLLVAALPPELVSQANISFAPPDSQFPPSSVTLPAIDLFLYDIRENRELRSGEWIVDRHSDGSLSRQRPPARIDCSYLITAWPSTSSTTPDLDEHRVLGEVMQVLLQYQTIPSEVLRGSLAGQHPPLPTTSLQPGHLQSLSEFWQALGGKPKAVLTCTVTIGVVPREPAQSALAVTDAQFKLRLGTGQP